MAVNGLKKESFSRRERLRLHKDFIRVFKIGKRIKLSYLLLVIAPNEIGIRRVGLSVSKKVGKAVERNRIKRRLREIFRRNKEIFPEAHDIIFIPKKELIKFSEEKIIKDLRDALKRL